eukprot:605485-Pelagomonas_calceolata.AAC.1
MDSRLMLVIIRTEAAGLTISRCHKEKKLRRKSSLPTSIKEKETHWLLKSREPPPPREKKDKTNVDLEGYWKLLALEPNGCGRHSCFQHGGVWRLVYGHNKQNGHGVF